MLTWARRQRGAMALTTMPQPQEWRVLFWYARKNRNRFEYYYERNGVWHPVLGG